MKNINNKKIPFVPGWGQKPKHYRSLSKYLNIINIDWNDGKFNVGKVDTIIGFSLGADLASWYTIKHPVKRLILCSPSPMGDLKGVKADEIIFIVGSKETFLKECALKLYNQRTGKKKFIIIPGGNHSITGRYKKTLLNLLKG